MKLTLEIGATCPPISRQLKGKIDAEDAHTLDRDNDAITRCYLMGYMPEATAQRARKYLIAKCQRAIERRRDANVKDEPRRHE